MDRSAKGWIYNVARLHFWRVVDWYEFDDLVQDGFFFYHRITERYSGVKEPKHVMALFKTAFTNHIHDLAKKRTLERAELIEADLGVDLENIECALYSLPSTPCLPPMLQKVVHVLETNPRARRGHRVVGVTRETTNRRLCRLIGEDPNEIDILKALRSYLKGRVAGAKDPVVN